MNAIIGTVITDNEDFTYDEMDFAINEVSIDNLVRGSDVNSTITILQIKSLEDPFLKKGGEVLLF